jgi:hypothetical protein
MSDLVLTPFDPPQKDDRFTKFREWIDRAYIWKWNAKPRWGGMEARNLWNLLQEMPELTEKDFCLALKNLVNSADIPAMQRPGYWLPKLDSYIVHHHNTFGRNPNAPTETFANRDERSLATEFEKARALRSGAGTNRLSPRQVGPTLGPGGDDGRSNQSVARRPGCVSGGGD